MHREQDSFIRMQEARQHEAGSREQKIVGEAPEKKSPKGIPAGAWVATAALLAAVLLLVLKRMRKKPL